MPSPKAVDRVRALVRPVRVAFEPGSFSPRDRAFIMGVLRDRRGWGRRYEVVSRDADVVLHLRDATAMRALFGAHAHLRGLSVTDTRTRPAAIYVHARNWDSPPAGFTGDTRAYRAYLVQHEMGHALGHGHAPMRTDGGPCAVMYQQSKGTSTCAPNPWPMPRPEHSRTVGEPDADPPHPRC